MANFDTARAALETSLGSEGSALEEHAKWSDSLEARLNKLKATWQSLSLTFMKSDFLKAGISGITGFVDGIDKLIAKIGVIPTLLGAFAIGKFIKNFVSLGASITSVADAVDILKISFPTLSKVISASKNALSAFIGVLSTGGNLFAAFSAGFSALNPVLLGIAAAVAAIGAAAYVIDKKTESAAELAERIDEVTSNYKEQHNELKKIKGDYDTSNEDSMISKYGELSKGVNELGENLSLIADEYAEYQSIVDKMVSQNPDLIAGYNSQGKAIIKNAGDVDALAQSYKELVKAQNEEILGNKTGKKGAGRDILKDFENDLKDTTAYYKEQVENENGELVEVSRFDTKHMDTLEKLMNLEGDELEAAISELSYDEQKRISDLLSEYGLAQNVMFDEGIFDFSRESTSEHLSRVLNDDKSKIKEVLDSASKDLNAYAEEMGTITEAYLSDAFLGDYAHLSERMQNAISSATSGLGADFYSQFVGKENGYELLTGSLESMLSAFNKMSDTDAAQFEAAFDLKTKFNGGDISYGEYVDGLQETGKLIDGLGLDEEIENQIKLSLGLNEKGFVDQYQTLLNRLKQTNENEIATGNVIGLSNDEAQKLLDDLSAKELSVLTQIIPEIDANATREQIQAAIDREMVLSGLVFDLNLEVEAAGIESLNTALSESVTASGLSSESIAALKGRYAELESQGWDLSSMFEETSHGIHLNRNELSKFENELSKQKLDKINGDLDKMKSEYDKLGEAIKNATGAEKAELFNKRQSLAQEIAEAATLASQYQGLTSAYNDWVAAESAGNERDMYENVISGFETVKDELSRGWADDGTVEFLELLTGRTDLAGKSGKELKEIYNSLDDTIKNTTHSVRDFFTVDKEGNSTSKGVYNFLDAVGQLEEEAFGGKDVVKRDGKGNIIGFDFNLVGGDEAIAEALGVREEIVQIMVRAADDAGFVISMDGTYKQLADLQNEAKAAADYLKEIGKTDFDFDFNTSSVTDLKNQLAEAKKIWKNEDFWNEDDTFNFDAKGATEAMQVVSTLQAKVDKLSQEKYGIGLTVEDKKFEEPLEKLQTYGQKIAELNQLKLNPKTNAEEIDKLEGELDTIAQDLIDLSNDSNIDIGIEAGDDVETVKQKIADGEIKIPTTLDIQTNMDKNLSDLRDLALLNSNLLSEEQENAIKVRLGIEVEPKVNNPEAVDEAIKEADRKKRHEMSERKLDINLEPEVTNPEAIDETVKEEVGVETGADGQLAYRQGVKLEPEVDTSGAAEKIEEKTKETVENQSGETTTLEQDVQLEFNINDYVDELSQFKDVAKELDGLDDVDVKINASLDGELNSDDIDKLGKFAEGAKALQGVKSSDVSVDVDFDGNLNNAEGLDKLIEFANGAKALQGIKSSDVSVDVELECEFNGGDLDSLAKFVDSASKIEGVKSSDVSVSVELDGNLNEYKGNLEDIGIFADNAKKLVGVDNADVSIKVSLKSEFNETNLDDLTKFVDNASKLNGIEGKEVSIAANLNGNLNNNTNLDNLEAFVTRAKDLQSVESKEVNILANLNGNLNNNTNIDNLESFAKNASMLSDAESKEINITANLNGNLNNNTNIDNLEEFAKRAESLQGLEDTKVNITANLNGNLNNNTNIDNLREFANRAADLQGLEDTKVNIIANLNGNLNNNTNIDNLEQFADRAEDLQGLEDVAINITANLNGNLNNNTNIDNLEEFADRAEDLQGMKDAVINITANLNGNLNNNTNIDNLEEFADKAKDLQGLEDTKVNISANLNGNLSNNTNIDNLEAFSDAAKDLQSVGNVSVSVKVNVDSASISNAIEVLSDVADSGVFKDYNASITVQTVGADKVNNLKTTLSNIKNKTIKILVKGAEAALKAIKSVASALNGIESNKTIKIKTKGKSKTGGSQEEPEDKTAKVNYEKGTQEEPDNKTAYVNYSLGTQESPVDKEALVNYKKGSQEPPANMTALVYYKRAGGGGAPAAGTAHSDGTTGNAFAHGYWGIGNNGVALGGELGQELVVRDGHFFTIGDKGAEFFRYKKNDIVFNATQTRALFRYGGIRGANPRGKMLATGSAFAQGNAFAQGKAFSGGSGGMQTETVVVGTNEFTGKKYTRTEGEGAEDFQETIDFIEIAIERIERIIDNIDRTVNNIYKSWADRNGALMDELSEIAEAINAQQQAYETYMKAAEGVELDDEWVQKIQNGDMSIETVEDEALKQQIDDYKEYYEAALDALDAIEELKETESELNAQRVENAKKEYDGILGVIEHEKNMLEEYINQSEEQAWLVSAEYYNALANNERENIAKLQEQKAAMIEAMGEAMASGTIAEGSEGW